ncbi:MAG: hypothetical protein GY708_26875 [Actinomycetia bacterium]|nr:hypothetical protein [Actinomycetes bacterium]MCP4959187.1 hypothetical protein [Actinomycetes bacterium]
MITVGVASASMIAWSPISVRGEYGLTVPMLALTAAIGFEVVSGRMPRHVLGVAFRWTTSPLALWVIASTVLIPLVFAGTAVFRTAEGQVPLGLGARNFFHLAQLGVFAAIAGFIGHLANSGGVKRRQLARSFVASGWVCAAFGVLQVSYNLGWLPEVERLFNNPSFAHNPGQRISESIPRLSALLVEPSFAAAFIAGYTAFVAMLFVGRSCVASQTTLGVSTGLGVLMLAATASTTGAVGLGTVLASLLFARRGRTIAHDRRALGILVATIAALVVFVIVAATMLDASIADGVSEVVTEKAESDSALSRAEGERLAFETLFATGGLGAGWGSGDAFSLASSIAVGLGIPGIALALNALWCRRHELADDEVARAARTALVVSVLAALASVPQYVLFHFWILCGLGLRPRIAPLSGTSAQSPGILLTP